MSIEREVRKARRALVLWRLLGDLVGFPALVLDAVSRLFKNIEKTVFYYELDAARRYRALTGVDLGVGLGEDARYAGLDKQSAEDRDEAFRESKGHGDH